MHEHIIYHGNCYDGWGAAWVARKRFPEAVLHPVLHGQPIPDVPEGVDVWMVDISFPRPEMEAFRKNRNLRVLDHHKTAQAALAGFPNTVFDMTKSGAMLAWEEFFPEEKPPTLLQYVMDQDLWTWKERNSHEICSYIRSFPRLAAAWDQLDEDLNSDFFMCVESGAAIMRSEAQRVEEMCEQAQFRKINGYLVPVVNASVCFSAVGNRLCQMYPSFPFAAYYFDRSDSVRQWGLRSIGDFDVSEVAKEMGGGGHKNTAGYQEGLSWT